YVEGAKRQQDLNEAYDGLLDLAGVIGVSPKALSLNGELGLAFQRDGDLVGGVLGQQLRGRRPNALIVSRSRVCTCVAICAG
ncbi:MAG: hypothetical protein HC788_13895, partial [Sphingopyxis sp.]|nr:hypothetical protein [Sphingopyxis sp.]